MTSAFSSALAKLDDCLRNVRSQLDSMRAALEVNDEQFNRSLADAVHQAGVLRDLIRAERPDANWMDRDTLDQFILAVGDKPASEASPASAL